jgi:uncharacterized protein with PQ loop repeat
MKEFYLKPLYERYMLVIGFIGQFTFYIQAYEIYLHGSAKNVSLYAYLVTFIVLSSWLAYGIILENLPLIISNLLGVIGVSVLIMCIYLYS